MTQNQKRKKVFQEILISLPISKNGMQPYVNKTKQKKQKTGHFALTLTYCSS